MIPVTHGGDRKVRKVNPKGMGVGGGGYLWRCGVGRGWILVEMGGGRGWLLVEMGEGVEGVDVCGHGEIA